MARYIDADALIEHLREYKTVYGVPMTDSDKQVVHCIIGHIKNLEPTAYDVEAVVAELESKMLESSSAQSEAIIGMCGASANYYCGEKDAYQKAIEIVRGKE